ncbi:hypothetical protein OAO65_05560 [Flavobacteriales bacterium]|nr:hypothetical protein [Flavobacteriales bacterium]
MLNASFYGIEAVGCGIFTNPTWSEAWNPFDEIFHGPQCSLE